MLTCDQAMCLLELYRYELYKNQLAKFPALYVTAHGQVPVALRILQELCVLELAICLEGGGWVITDKGRAMGCRMIRTPYPRKYQATTWGYEQGD